MTILVVGAGATGGWFGARLAQAGRDVTFLVRPHRAEQLRERGLRIIGPDAGPDQREVVRPRLVLAEELTEPADLVLLSVKATALEAAIADLAPAVGPRTVVVPFLNGMAHLDALNRRFGEPAVLGGVVRIFTQLDEEGDVVQLRPTASLTIGTQDGTRTTALQAAHEQLSGAGFDTDVSDEILAMMWQKWVFIATIGALTCLMRGAVGEIVAVPGGRELGPAMLAEAAAVAAAAGYPVPEGAIAGTTQTITEAGSATNSSMSRDVAQGRPTEVEHLLADLGRRGAEHGIRTPLLDLATMHLRVHNNRLLHGRA
ncbi:MAG TPA: ketopantoate reductase family protein [Sporichthyaceae bacterium]|jgi:2-dehydropantoate 2-reductase|nr:ketopantoate reductase family protein [Sporichthyaceae bacterium]